MTSFDLNVLKLLLITRLQQPLLEINHQMPNINECCPWLELISKWTAPITQQVNKKIYILIISPLFSLQYNGSAKSTPTFSEQWLQCTQNFGYAGVSGGTIVLP